MLDNMRSLADIEVIEKRFVKDGKVWTSAGTKSLRLLVILKFNRQRGKRRLYSPPDIMDMPFHEIVYPFNVRTVFTDQHRGLIVFDHRVDCPATFATSVSVPRTTAAVLQRHSDGNEFKMGVIAVFGTGKYFRQGNRK